MTKEVRITIRGVQLDAEEEPIVITASGMYHFANGSHYIQYEEKVEDTDSVLKNIMKISHDRIIISKKGIQSSQMVFDVHEADQAVYQTPYGSLSFTTNTDSILLNETEDRIVVRMKYTLSSEDLKLSENEITIIIDKINEE